MYRIIFGNELTAKRLYLFRVDKTDPNMNLLYGDQPDWGWNDVTAQAGGITLRYDPINENGIFTPILRTTLELTLIRENESDFQDIINAEEGDYMAVVTEGSTLAWRTTGSEGGQLYISGENPKLLFKGYVTNESYGESYNHFAPVNLTFTDRLTELGDLMFSPTVPQMRLSDIFADLFSNLPTAYRLFLEFDYDVDTVFWKDIKSPRNILLDVTKYNDEKKLDVLTDILESFGLQLFNDYETFEATYFTFPYLYSAGAIRIRQVDTFVEYSTNFYGFTLTSGAYVEDYEDSTTELVRTPLIIPNEYNILGRSGRWQLARRAKYIDALNVFQIKENIIYPDEFNINDFDYEVNGIFDLTYRYWFYYEASSVGDLIDKLESIAVTRASEQQAYATRVGIEKKLAVMIRQTDAQLVMDVITSPVLMIKSPDTMRIDIECWSNQATRNVYINLVAIHDGTVYLYDATSGWIEYVGSLATGFRVQPDDSVYYTDSFEDIPQPTAITSGQNYQLLVYFRTGNTAELTPNKYTFITDFNLSLNVELPPSKLKVRTLISDTKRKPIEFESQFYNLPNISGNTAIYSNGILATGLDYYVGGILDTPNSDRIIAPETLSYEGNNATLLVHLSEIVGYQNLIDRWRFFADIIKGTLTARYLAEWFDGICATGYEDVNTGYLRYKSYRVIKTLGGEVESGYPLVYSILTDVSPALTASEYAALSDNDFDTRVAAFRAYVDGEEGVTLLPYETNDPSEENTEICPLPSDIVTISVSLTWIDTESGVTDGFGGYVLLENIYQTEVDRNTFTGNYNQLEFFDLEGGTDSYRLNFANVTAYIAGSQTLSVFIRHKVGVDGDWVYGNVSGYFTESASIIAEIQTTSFV